MSLFLCLGWYLCVLENHSSAVTNYYFESMNFDGFKERGVSKENKDTAIVQMGLFIDNNGIPITYELFSGNTNDLSTMRPILDKI